MQPPQQQGYQHLRLVLGKIGADAEDFLDEDLKKLWVERYRTEEDFQKARADGLRQMGLPMTLVDQIISAQEQQRERGVAAGLGLGRPAGADAPAPKRLVDSAAKLRQLADSGTWELHYSQSMVTYFDATGLVDRIRIWARAAMMAAVETHRPNAPPLLVVSGLVKSGKSFTQEHVVPAVVAEALHKQGAEGPLAGMVVLRLRCDGLCWQEGAAVMLRSLLAELLDWAREEHVPMREDALEAARDALAQPLTDPSVPGRAIQKFLKAVEVPVLALCDEAQSLFLPTVGGKLDKSGAGYIRDSFMKRLLVYGPQTMLWCLTGSSMARTWISLADMPPNGYAVISTTNAAHLPATHSAEHMSLAWELLQRRYPHVPLDPQLLELCPPSIALLAVLVDSWIVEGYPRDVAAFVRGFVKTKLVDESLKEWKLALEGMPLPQRLAVLDLSSPSVGARIDTDLHSGLRRFLEPHLDKKRDGRYYLRAVHQRQIVRLLLNNDGTLQKSWSELEGSASLTQLDAERNLFRLGEVADYLLGHRASRLWKGKELPAGTEEFKAKLQAIAQEIVSKLASAAGGAALSPRELWGRQSWFQTALQSRWNSFDRADYEENKLALSTHLDMLVFYLRLSRNVLGHVKPWEPEFDTVLVDVIEVLPSVLEQSLFDFNEGMVGALRLVSRQTAEEAAAAFNAQQSGGDGDSVEGLAEDKGSSSGGLSSSTDRSSSSGLRRGSSSGGLSSSSSSRGLSSGAAGCSGGGSAAWSVPHNDTEGMAWPLGRRRLYTCNASNLDTLTGRWVGGAVERPVGRDTPLHAWMLPSARPKLIKLCGILRAQLPTATNRYDTYGWGGSRAVLLTMQSWHGMRNLAAPGVLLGVAVAAGGAAALVGLAGWRRRADR